MNHSLEVNFIADRKSLASPLAFTANPGDFIFLSGAPKNCQTHFEVLTGLRKPDVGTVKFLGTDPYTLDPEEGAVFRRDNIGAIPFGGGLLPELPMVSQVALPMELAGFDKETILKKIQATTTPLMPLHTLYNLPGQSTPRKRTHAAILRATLMGQSLVVIDRELEDRNAVDTEILWEILVKSCQKDKILIYLSGAPAPEEVPWTQEIRL